MSGDIQISTDGRPAENSRRSLLKRVLDATFGYDFFISYTRRDGGKDYAEALARRLKSAGFQIFFDSDEYAKGDDWKVEGKWALRRTSQLILVASPEALSSAAVVREVEIYSSLPGRRIIPIDFGGTIRHRDETKPVFQHLRSEILFIEEHPERLGSEPSEDTVKELRDGFNLKRQDKKRARIFGIIASVLVALTIMASIAAVFAYTQQKKAEEQTIEANRNLSNVNWQLAQQARGLPFASNEMSATKAAWHLLRAAKASEDAGQEQSREDAILAANAAASHLNATLLNSGAMNGAQFSPDGRRILGWSGDGTARLWDGGNGMPIGQIMMPEKGAHVLGAQFSADGRRIFTWSQRDSSNDIKSAGRAMIHLWDGANGQPVGRAMWHERGSEPNGLLENGFPNWSVQFSADGRRIISWSSSGIARLWDADECVEIGESLRHANDEGVLGALFSPRALSILTWGKDGSARMWDGEKGTQIGLVLELAPARSVLGARFSANAEKILTWGDDGRMRLWNASDGEPVGQHMLHGKAEEVFGAQFSADGKRIISWTSGTREGDGFSIHSRVVRLWDAAVGKQIGQTMNHEDESGVPPQFSRDGMLILTWNGLSLGDDETNGTVLLWDAVNGLEKMRLRHADAKTVSATFSPDGRRILTWSSRWDNEGSLRLWDAAQGKQIGMPMENGEGKNVAGAQFSADGRRIISWSRQWDEGSSARLWDTAEGRILRHEREECVHAQFGAEGGRVLTWSKEGTVRSWDMASGAEIGDPQQDDQIKESMPAQEQDSGGQCISVDGRRVVTWTDSRTAILEDTRNNETKELNQGALVQGARFSADGLRILMWSSRDPEQDNSDRESSVCVWDAKTGNLIGQPMTHDEGKMMSGARFNANCQRILSWSEDGTARLWSATTNFLIAVFRHDEPVTMADFDPSEEHVLTVGEDGSVFLWDISLDPSSAIEDHSLEFAVRSATTLGDDGRVRSLSEDEWKEKRRLWEEIFQKRPKQ